MLQQLRQDVKVAPVERSVHTCPAGISDPGVTGLLGTSNRKIVSGLSKTSSVLRVDPRSRRLGKEGLNF